MRTVKGIVRVTASCILPLFTTACGEEQFADQSGDERATLTLAQTHEAIRSTITDTRVVELLSKLNRQVEDSPESASAHGELAMAYDANGFETLAEQSYQHAVNLDPTDFKWHYLYALRLIKNGNLDHAVDELLTGLSLDDSYPPLYIRLANAQSDSGAFVEALANFRKAVARDAGPAAQAGVAVSLLKLERPQQALTLLHELVRKTNHPSVHRYIGMAHRMLGNEELARKAFDLAGPSTDLWFPDPIADEVQGFGVSTNSRLKEVQNLLASQDLNASIKVLTTLADENPNNFDVQYQLGLVYVRLHEFELAEHHLQNAIEAEPFHYPSLLLLASLYQGQEDDVKAANTLQKVIQVYPNLTVAHQELAYVQLRLEQTSDALQSFENAIAADSVEPNVHYYTGVLLGEQGRCREALQHFRNTIALDSGHIKAHTGAAMCAIQLRDRSTAQTYLDQARVLGATEAELQLVRSLLATP